MARQITLANVLRKRHLLNNVLEYLKLTGHCGQAPKEKAEVDGNFRRSRERGEQSRSSCPIRIVGVPPPHPRVFAEDPRKLSVLPSIGVSPGLSDSPPVVGFWRHRAR